MKKKTMVIWHVKSTIPIIAWLQAVFFKDNKILHIFISWSSCSTLFALSPQCTLSTIKVHCTLYKHFAKKCANWMISICDLQVWFQTWWNTSASTFSQMNQFQGDPFIEWSYRILSSTTSCFRIILSIISSRMISYTT